MEIGKRIGDYEILGELGCGGMGRVYRVRNVISDRVEAMKVLLPDLAGRQDLAARFLREIKLVAALNHPNIAALRTALTADNQLVMIMEYVEGQTLADRLVHGPIATADALAYIDQVLDALTYAHAQGVVHRDIKPANVMLTPSGVVKLTDFGIARATTDETITVVGTTTGSLSYMAPEQVNGQTTDARSDLYSVGISLYEMVTGQRPFQADSDFHVMLAHLKQEPRPPVELQPSLPAALNGIILRSIAKNPAERFQSADELRQALRSVPSAVLGATTTRHATVLLATPPPAAPGAAPAPGQQSDHARTVLDTRTPSAPPAAMRGSEPWSIHAAQPVPMRSGHPFIFVALGAVLVIAALTGVGLYLGLAEAGPGSGSALPATPASEEAEAGAAASGTTAVSQASGDLDSASTAPAAAPSDAAPPALAGAAGGDSGAASAPGTTRSDVAPQPGAPAAGRGSAPVATPPPAAPKAPTPSTAPAGQSAAVPAPQVLVDSAELDAIEADVDQLSARAGALNSSLDRLQQQQAQQGLGLRGDMAARQESMRINLSRAQHALDQGDAPRARKYRDAARSDIEALERFLGR